MDLHIHTCTVLQSNIIIHYVCNKFNLHHITCSIHYTHIKHTDIYLCYYIIRDLVNVLCTFIWTIT